MVVRAFEKKMHKILVHIDVATSASCLGYGFVRLVDAYIQQMKGGSLSL